MIIIKHDWLKRLLAFPFRFCGRVSLFERYLRRRIALAKGSSPMAKSVPLRQRVWAMRHGFYADRVLFYGLNRDNVEKFLPDFIYESLHPINGRFSPMIDDKTILPILLKDFPEHAPVYHYLVYDSEMIGLSSSNPETERYKPEKLLPLLGERKKLIIKPLGGSRGEGLLLIEATGGAIFINGNEINERDALLRLTGIDHHIVCQFEQQHQYANELFPSTTNTIRFVTMRDYDTHTAFIGACFHRVGTLRSIPVDNIGQGGLHCMVNMESGVIGRAIGWRAETGLQILDVHPDTGVPLSGKVIPGWDYVRSEVLRMADRLAFLPYMGWDIVITGNGFKVLEINSLPGISWQVHKPICDNPRAKEFYSQIIRKKGLATRWK